MPRHSWHTGYGLRDLRRVMTGPAYARALSAAASAAGAELRTSATVTGWTTGPDGSHAVTVTSPAGLETVKAAAVLLATGCRERPRPARLVPGDRRLTVMDRRRPGRVRAAARGPWCGWAPGTLA